MPNRQQPQDSRQKGHRNPVQTSPDDDEAPVADQTTAAEAADDARPTQGKRRPLQASQESEDERLAQAGEEGVDEDEDEDEDDDLDVDDDVEDDKPDLRSRR
jgi:hypothetical protein